MTRAEASFEVLHFLRMVSSWPDPTLEAKVNSLWRKMTSSRDPDDDVSVLYLISALNQK